MSKKIRAAWKDKTSYWLECKNALKGKNEIIVFDLETTGLNPAENRIIEIAAVKYDFDFETFKITEKDVLHFFMNPKVKLPDIIVDITGITDSFLADKPTEEDLFQAIDAFFNPNAVVAGYNSDRFDCKFMENYYGRMGKVFRCAGTVDAMKLAKSMLEKGVDVDSYKLINIGDYFGIDFSAHSAIEDTRCTAKVMQIMLLEGLKAQQERLKPISVTTTLIKPDVWHVRFWEGFRGFSRIYVETSAGSVYYDIRNYKWGGKDVDISTLDMDHIQAEAWKKVGACNEDEFQRYKGSA